MNSFWFEIFHTVVCEIFMAIGLFFLIFALPVIIEGWTREWKEVIKIYKIRKNEEEENTKS